MKLIAALGLQFTDDCPLAISGFRPFIEQAFGQRQPVRVPKNILVTKEWKNSQGGTPCSIDVFTRHLHTIHHSFAAQHGIQVIHVRIDGGRK
jgi:hypothetical protein